MSWPCGLRRQGPRGQYRHEGQPDGRSPAATRRQSRARCLSLTLLAPGSEPFRYILMGDGPPPIKLLEASLNLIQLPSLRFHVGGNGFGRKKRFGATGALCERLELVLGVAVDPH